MKIIIGTMLSILGEFAAWACGIGVMISLVLWILSLLGMPLVVGAGAFIFKFAGGWILGLVFGLLGVSMVSGG
jgi:hypothetical protein